MKGTPSALVYTLCPSSSSVSICNPAGLSQEALAAQLGVSRQAVSKWERSESSPDTDNLIALAALYGVSLDELLYGEAASDVDTSADDDVDANNSGESEGAESSTEHVDSDGKPLVDISLARGIHVIDPNKGKEVHVGWNGIHFPLLSAPAHECFYNWDGDEDDPCGMGLRQAKPHIEEPGNGGCWIDATD